MMNVIETFTEMKKSTCYIQLKKSITIKCTMLYIFYVLLSLTHTYVYKYGRIRWCVIFARSGVINILLYLLLRFKVVTFYIGL